MQAPLVVLAALLDVLAVVGGKVHTMVPGEAPREATILIEDGRIRAVGEDLAVPEGARTLQARGLHIVPGLIDGFAYHDPEHDALYTAAGVTLVRDHGNSLGRIFKERDPRRRDLVAGPALSVSGAVLDGYPPSSGDALLLRDEPEERQQILARLLQEKPDFLSCQLNLSKESWKAVVAAAHAAEGGPLQVWGPLPKALDLQALLEGGQDGLLFLDAFVPRGKTWEDVSDEELDQAVQRVAAAGIRVTPLLRGVARALVRKDAASPDFRLLGLRYERVWLRDREATEEVWSEERSTRGRKVLERQQRLLRTLDGAGVPLVPGSGAPHPWLMPGRGLVEELQEWELAGLPAQRVLELATAGSARALGLAERGTLAAGSVADLVGVRGDPAESLDALHDVELVVMRGRALDADEIEEALEKLATLQAQLRERAKQPIEVAAPALPEGELVMSGRVQTVSDDGPLAAERWAVVRSPDGSIAFCGRKKLLGDPGEDPVELETRQVWHEQRLSSFQVTIRAGGRELVAKGIHLAGHMRVERRLDGAFIANQTAREQLAAIDVGSVTTLLLLAHTCEKPGPFPVLRFHEGLDLEVVRWDLQLEEDADHWFRTPHGLKAASFGEEGALLAVLEDLGGTAVKTQSEELDLHGGPGLPLPDSKRERIRAAQRKALEEQEKDKEKEKPKDSGGG